VFANAAHRPFVLANTWKSAVPPAENQLVDVELDADGTVTAVAVVGAPLADDPARYGGQAFVNVPMVERPKRRPLVRPIFRWAFAIFFVLPLAGYLAYNYVIVPVVSRQIPLIAVGQAVKAYREHDIAAFHEYVDIRSVLDDGVDQVVPAKWLGGAVKAEMTPDLVLTVDHLVGQETSPGPSESSEESFASQTVKNVLRSAVRRLKFDGLGPDSIDGDVAHIEVRMSRDNRIIPIQARLQWRGDHWQIVAIENLPNIVEALM